MSKLNLGLYEHVEEAIQAVISTQVSKGRIVIPTGGGKTAVEAHSLRLKGLKGDFKIHLVLSPRIALTNQLIKEYRDYIGQNYLSMAFHSGRDEKDTTKVRWETFASTSKDVVLEQIERAKSMGKHLVIFSTYHSAWKLVDLDLEFGMVIADESQYCTSKEYFDVIVKLKADFKGFFTATEKHVETTDLGRGLNNETVFGKIIYTRSAKELIDRGVIVAPRLHIMEAEKVAKTHNSITDETIRIAQHQHQLTIDQGMPYSKILFAMNGTDDIRKIISDIKKIKAAMPTHRIFTIMSNEKYGAMIDGEKIIRYTHNGQIWEDKISRTVFFRELRESNNVLIFHYDIISEGIDIDGITGVVINRNMSTSKLLQTIGRAVRKYKANPDLKPWAWVTVPVIDNDIENRAFVEDTLKTIMSGGFAVDNIKFTGTDGPGIDDDDGLDDQYGIPQKGTIQTMVQNVVHEIQDNAFFSMLANTTFEERMKLAMPTKM
jgi:superfamily II DNA or RNA helicase